MATPSDFYPQPLTASKRPPPRPPRVLKPQIYTDPRVFETVDQHAINEAEKKYSNWRDLLWNLIFKKNLKELEKARVIFRYLTMRADTGDIARHDRECSPGDILRNCRCPVTHSRKFELLASYAGLHCVSLTGWAKGGSYRPGSPITAESVNHSWNAVYIDGNWQLVDCKGITCLGAHERPNYDDFFFIPESSKLIYIHCPEDSEWQLCNPVHSKVEFEDTAYTTVSFFTLGMKFLQQNQGIIYTHNGIAVLTLGMTKPMAFSFGLSVDRENSNEVDRIRLRRYVMQETTDKRVSYFIRAPRDGIYYLTVNAERISENSAKGVFQVCQFKVVCDRAATDVESFPECTAQQWGPGALVEQRGLIPSQVSAVIMTSDGVFDVTFMKLRDCCVDLSGSVVGKSASGGQKRADVNVTDHGDEFSIMCRLPDLGEYGLEIYAQNTSRNEEKKLICQYLLSYTNRNPQDLYGQVYDQDLSDSNAEDLIPYNYPRNVYAALSGDSQTPTFSGNDISSFGYRWTPEAPAVGTHGTSGQKPPSPLHYSQRTRKESATSPRMTSTASLSCPVCMEDYKQIRRAGGRLASTKCGHVFCETCIRQALDARNDCPTCRMQLPNESDVHPIFL